jgi:hypothetical protein
MRREFAPTSEGVLESKPDRKPPVTWRTGGTDEEDEEDEEDKET